MRCFLFSLVSWGSLLLLIMPGRKLGLAQTAALLVLGAIWIIREKPKFQERMLRIWPIGACIYAMAILGRCFYDHWTHSYKIPPIAAALHLPVNVLVTAATVGLVLCAGAAVFYGTRKLYVVLTDQDHKADIKRGLSVCLVMACITVVLAQFMIDVDVLYMGLPKFLGNMLIPAVAGLLLYALLGSLPTAAALGTGIFMGLATANAYVYQFRGRLLEPVDVFSVRTALNVAENYSLWPVPNSVVVGWILWLAALLGMLCVIPKRKTKLSGKHRGILVAVGCVAAVMIGCCCAAVAPRHWEKEGAYFNGYILNFAAKVKETIVLPPEGYSPEAVEQLADRYAQENDRPERTPHVIVIMDEAFADLSVHGKMPTNTDVMPFISSLKENTIRGYALASVYGGNTANSEFEFLTGNTMAWLAESAVPYQQYIRGDAYSMVSYLKGNYGYQCVAMHPYLSSGWNRPAVYGHLGFDEMYFLEDFPQENMIRGYVSDREMFESVIAAFEARRQEPMFLFGVSMQNHGGYADRVDGFENTVTLTGPGMEYPDAEQYLSLVRETDRAVEYLIQYFAAQEEEVVILFFGDHQPKLNEDFLRALGNDEQTLEDRQKRYQVPFFVWANYDIPEEDGIMMGLNGLSTLVYEAAGIPLPKYNRFLAEMAEHIPVINSQGFYSNASGCYLPFEAASPEEQRWLADYRILQYNSLWDQDGRSDRWFPLLSQ